MEYNDLKNGWQKLLKKKLTANDALVVAVNLVPLIGVWVWGWDAREMFLVYCLESVIVGFYNVIQMFITTLYKKKDIWDDKTGVVVSGYFFITFFILHYGFFIFIQMGLFLSTIDYPGLDGFGSAFTFLFHFPRYLSTDALMVLLIFVFTYGVLVARRFIGTGNYKTMSLGIIMFTPYPRIFVQQFVVIVGSFVLMFGSGASKIFMLIFVTVKIFFEIFLDYDRLLLAAQKKETD